MFLIKWPRLLAEFRGALVSAAFGAVVFPLDAYAQKSLKVTGAPVCQGCRIEVQLVRALRPPPNLAAFIFPTALVHDRNGNFIVLDPKNAEPVHSFDSAGAYLPTASRVTTQLGRTFARALAITSGDTL